MESWWVGIKPDHSLLGLLGKLFFRHQPTWVQRRKMGVLFWSIVVGLFCGGVIVAGILAANGH